jgi:hypothetical protein
MRPLLAIAAMSICGIVATSPQAAAPSEDQAFERFEAGEVQFKAGHFDAAAALFEEAYTLKPDPAYLFNVALSFEKQGRWALAVQHYERFLEAHGDVPNAPDVRRRLEAARTSRAATRAVISIQTVPSGAQVVAETHPDVAPCESPCDLRVDPGPVTLVLTRGNARAIVSKSLGPAETWQVVETLQETNTSLATGQPEADRTGAIIAWSAGGAALLTGIVFGVMANKTHSDGEALAGRGPLSSDDAQKLSGLQDDLGAQSLVADIGFGAAIAGGIVGTVLWLTGDGDDADQGGLAWRF